MTRTFFLEFASNKINGLSKTEKEEEEEEEAFEQTLKPANDILINEIPGQPTKKSHSSNTVLKYIKDDDYNEQDNLNSAI
ncbi:17982_t:CDS:1, partial [Racocetra fulgida]